FSLQPFRVVEFVWPNVFGTPDRGNKFWLGALPPRDANVKVWVRTLYLGGLTLVLALGGWGVGSRSDGESAPWRSWMAIVMVVSLLGSFGEHCSPISWARMVPNVAALVGLHIPSGPAAAGPDRVFHDGDGGVYWLLATGLPGFGQFRFPSKLLTFTVLGL